MRENILDKLDQIDERLEAEEKPQTPELSEGDNGPEEVETPDNDAGEGEPGPESLDDYLLDMAQAVMAECDLDDEDEAIDMVFDVLDQMAEDGEIDPVPEEGDTESEVEWMGKAKSVGLTGWVLDACDEEDAE